MIRTTVVFCSRIADIEAAAHAAVANASREIARVRSEKDAEVARAAAEAERRAAAAAKSAQVWRRLAVVMLPVAPTRASANITGTCKCRRCVCCYVYVWTCVRARGWARACAHEGVGDARMG